MHTFTRLILGFADVAAINRVHARRHNLPGKTFLHPLAAIAPHLTEIPVSYFCNGLHQRGRVVFRPQAAIALNEFFPQHASAGDHGNDVGQRFRNRHGKILCVDKNRNFHWRFFTFFEHRQDSPAILSNCC